MFYVCVRVRLCGEWGMAILCPQFDNFNCLTKTLELIFTK